MTDRSEARKKARTLGLGWILVGLVELAWAAFCVFGGLILGLTGFADDDLGPVMWVLSGAYGVLALVNVPIGALHVATGVFLRRGSGLILTLASIAAGLASLVTALYCAPLTLGVIVWSFVVLADGHVRDALDGASDR